MSTLVARRQAHRGSGRVLRIDPRRRAARPRWSLAGSRRHHHRPEHHRRLRRDDGLDHLVGRRDRSHRRALRPLLWALVDLGGRVVDPRRNGAARGAHGLGLRHRACRGRRLGDEPCHQLPAPAHARGRSHRELPATGSAGDPRRRTDRVRLVGRVLLQQRLLPADVVHRPGRQFHRQRRQRDAAGTLVRGGTRHLRDLCHRSSRRRTARSSSTGPPAPCSTAMAVPPVPRSWNSQQPTPVGPTRSTRTSTSCSTPPPPVSASSAVRSPGTSTTTAPSTTARERRSPPAGRSLASGRWASG